MSFHELSSLLRTVPGWFRSGGMSNNNNNNNLVDEERQGERAPTLRVLSYNVQCWGR
jgi:hypothetical protein